MEGAIHKPSVIASMLELRAPFEAISLLPVLPFLHHAPRGEGQPVMVFPGFLAGDNSTYLLRRFLSQQGFKAFPWKMGQNPGLQDVLYRRLEKRVRGLYKAYGKPVSLVGWSLGGVYARTLAHRVPECIRQIVTLASPFNLSQNTNTEDVGVSGPIIKIYERLNPRRAEDELINGHPIWREAPPVPSTSIYSVMDGIASWKYCIDHVGEHTENLRVMGSHSGMTHNPLVLYALADRLAQAEGEWVPFEDKWSHRVFYGKSACASEVPD
jgi:pimeloyl-ACP methyl ester carboxylesterase